jgi:hypothetical protein
MAMTRTVRNRARKLTDDDVREIRVNPISGPVLAKHYGVTQKVIYAIRKGDSYQHVVGEEWRFITFECAARRKPRVFGQ